MTRNYFLLLTLFIAITVVSQETTSIANGRWNESSIWSNGVPDENTRAIIGKNTTVTLSGDHKAHQLVVHGTLTVSEDGGTIKTLQTDWVHVNSGGIFQIGTEQDRFDTGNFVLTLTGTDPNEDQNVPMANGMTMDIVDNNGFVMAGGMGRLQFFGADKISFTKLAETANVGQSTITVENIIDRNFDDILSANTDGEFNWDVGDEIVIASSSDNYNHEDVRIITALQDQGTTTIITLDRPLTYRHFGEIETYGTNVDSRTTRTVGPMSIDMRAEVGLLSRNIKIQGQTSQDTDDRFGDRARLQIGENGKASNGVGGHVMIMPTAGQITVEGVQLHLMGQAGRLGRYPFHWHVARDRKGDILRNTSITNSNNRAVVVHVTDNVLIEGVVAHDLHGHGIFTEDGVEQNNRFLFNLVLGVHRVHGDNDRNGAAFTVDLHDNFHDRSIRSRTTAGYWITNANNDFIGNICAGSEGSGYWFAPPSIPLGEANKIKEYRNYRPREEPLAIFNHNSVHSTVTGHVVALAGPIGNPIAEPGGDIREEERIFGDVDPHFENFTAYQNGLAFYPLVSNVRHTFTGLKVASNEYIHWDSDPTLIKDALMVGESRGNPHARRNGIRGNQLYHGNTIIENALVAGFHRALFFSTLGGGNRVRSGCEVEGLTYEDDGSYDNMNATLGGNFFTVRDIYDRDGSLTTPFGGGAGYSFIPKTDWALDESLGDIVGDRNQTFKAALSKHRFANLRIRGENRARIYITAPNGNRQVLGEALYPRAPLRWEGEYLLELPNGFDSNVNNLELTLHQWSKPSNTLGVFLRLKNMADVIKPRNLAKDVDLPKVNTMEELQNTMEDSYFTDANGDLVVRLMNRGFPINGNYIYFGDVSEPICTGNESITSTLSLNGVNFGNQSYALVNLGTAVNVGATTTANSYTVTKPNGEIVEGNMTIEDFSPEDHGSYIITTDIGCEDTVLLHANTTVDHLGVGKPAIQSSTNGKETASRAVDGLVGLRSRNSVMSNTLWGQRPHWWRLDLEDTYNIGTISINNRIDPFFIPHTRETHIYIGNEDSTDPNDYTEVAITEGNPRETFKNIYVEGRYVLLYNARGAALSLPEVEIYGRLPGLNDNQAPTISFKGLMDGDQFAVGDNLNVILQTDDPDGSITFVDLYVNGTPIRRALGSPFNFGVNQGDNVLGNLAEGFYEISAVARDNEGKMGSSPTILIVVGNPPDVDIPLDHIAIGKPVSQSSTDRGAMPSNAVDGNANGTLGSGSVSHTLSEDNSWWRLDLEDDYDISAIDVYNRTDCCSDRMEGVSIYVGSIDSTNPEDYTKIGDLTQNDVNRFPNTNIQGRYVFLRHNGTGALAIAEVAVQGTILPANEAPSVSFTYPNPSQRLPSGTDLVVTVSASDVDGSIDNITLSLDGQAIRVEQAAPYEWGLPTQNDALLRDMVPGNYQLTAVATDDDGATAETTIEFIIEDDSNIDSDEDGIPDTQDSCPNTPQGITVDSQGCEVFTLPSDNFIILGRGESCSTSNNGQIEITANAPLDYFATLIGDGIESVKEFTTNTTFHDLSAGTYQLCLTVVGQPDFESCSQIVIVEPEPLNVTTSLSGINRLRISLFGSEAYTVLFNNETYRTSGPEIELLLKQGQNSLEISTDLACQGKYLQTIELGTTSMAYPNPVKEGQDLTILLDTNEQELDAVLYTMDGTKVMQRKVTINASKILFRIDGIPSGLYMLNIATTTKIFNFKIIKE